jgi:hypothetical protein
MPADAKVLSVGKQFNEPVMWAIHETPSTPFTKDVRVTLAFTGWEFEYPASNTRYLGTVQLYEETGSPLVFHVFIDGE